MKKEYIRTTHNFDNDTREWTFRGDRGEEKYKEWNDPEVLKKITFRPSYPPFWSMGVHALKDDRWMGIEWIVDETIKMYKGGAYDRPDLFEKFIEENKDHREIIKEMVLEELEYLIKLDMVRERERK
jgi:hypothetical protein